MMATNKLTACTLAIAVVILLSGCSNKGGEPASTSAEHSTQAIPSPGTTQTELKITQWGPQNTKAGIAFNVQPDGSASFWVHTNRSLEGSDAVLVLNGVQLKSAISGSLITASVPVNLYNNPGDYELHIAMHAGKAMVQSDDVKFVVE